MDFELQYHIQLITVLLNQCNDRMARLELALNRNNDLVAALLRVSGLNINLSQIGYGAETGQTIVGKDNSQTKE